MKKKIHEAGYLDVCIDKPLTAEEWAEADAIALELRPDNLSVAPVGTLGDAYGSVPGRQHIAVLKRYLWPVGQHLRIRFLDGEPAVQDKVKRVAREWTQYANLSFDFVTSGNADIRISFQQKGASWSHIGSQARAVAQNQPTMNYGWLTPNTTDTEYNRVVLHEFGHAIGAIHEHQNPSANIPWDVQAVYAYYARTQGWSKSQTDTNLLKRYSTGETNYTQFDPKSIMLYAIPDELTIGTFSTGWNSRLSDLDKSFARTLYPRQAAQPELVPGGTYTAAAVEYPGEIDVFRFTVPERGRYVMGTQGDIDVTMSLWGPDEENVLRAFDDNSGLGYNTRIVRTLPGGTYWLKVQSAPSTEGGTYQIGVRRLG